MSQSNQGETSTMKVFIPKEYFKHAGYIDDIKSQYTESEISNMNRHVTPRVKKSTQQPFKERFNEKLEYPASQKSEKSIRRMINNGSANNRNSGRKRGGF